MLHLLKLRLINNSTIDLVVDGEELPDLHSELGMVMTDPMSLFSTQIGDTEYTIPGRNILFFELHPMDVDGEPVEGEPLTSDMPN